MSDPQPKGDVIDFAEALRARDKHVERLEARLDQVMAALAESQAAQKRMFEAMMAGRPALVSVPMEVEAPPAPALSVLTWAELWSRYVAALPKKGWVKPMISMMRKVNHHFAPSLCVRGSLRGRRNNPRILWGCDLAAVDMRPWHWTEFRERHIAENPDSPTTTRNHMLKRIKAAFNWAVEEGLIDRNPLANVKTEPKRPKRETVITEDDIERVKTPLVRAYLLALIDSGMRPGEVRTLRRDQFDDDGRTMLNWTKTKGAKSRPAWVTPRVLEAFAAIPKRPGNDYVFGSPRGNQPYSESRLWQLFHDERKAAGMFAAPGDGRWKHAHDGRRAFASHAAKANVGITKIQMLLGHSDISTTQGYISLDESDLVDAHRQLAEVKRRPPERKPKDTK